MGSSIPFDEQYFVELERNTRYQWLVFGLLITSLTLHGILFHWLPRCFRNRVVVDPKDHQARWYFKFSRFWGMWTNCVSFKPPFCNSVRYFQPSLVLLGLIYATVIALFCFVETSDLDYQPRYYIICKRLSRVGVGNLPMLMVMVMKNDLVTSISGLQHDRLIFLHKWLSRTMWLLVTIHLGLACKYWLSLDFPIMLVIPPQIFGMISYSCFVMLTWASNKWVRKAAYDFFLVQHRIFGFIMLLLSFFHNPGNKAVVIISVHLLVIDRVVMRVLGVIHRRLSPTKGVCGFELLDDDTIKVTIPVRKTWFAKPTWYTRILPKFSTWEAGQHVYLNVGKVSFLQYHPFTISNLAETEEIILVLRKQNGFTKKLFDRLACMVSEEKTPEVDDNTSTSGSEPYSTLSYEGRSNDSYCEEQIISIHDETSSDSSVIQLKASFVGPFGAKYQPLLPFDSCLLVCAGSGGSFVFPVALELLNELKRRDEEGDYLFRPSIQVVHLVWVIRQKENEKWYEHILEPLREYSKAGRLKLSIHVTQEEIEVIDSNTSFQTEKEKNDKASPKIYEIANSLSSNECGQGGRFKGRPNLANLIRDHATALETNNSLAVLSCGPKSFTNEIKSQCQVSRWRKNAPDIYCYSESF